MSNQGLFESCLPFITSETRENQRRSGIEGPQKSLAVTISRQTGSGAHCVATALARHLQKSNPPDSPPWAVFDRNLVEKVIEEHKLPARLARFMPEDRISELTDALDELLGVHPSSWTLVQQTSETIHRLAARGNVILIGRGAHVITSQMKHVFHVRLVASLQRRVQHMQELRGLTQREAMALVMHEDRGRKRYLQKYFGRDLDDPLAYHLTVNTDSVSYESAARLIADSALAYLQAECGTSRIVATGLDTEDVLLTGGTEARFEHAGLLA